MTTAKRAVTYLGLCAALIIGTLFFPVDAQPPTLIYGNNSGTVRPVAVDSTGITLAEGQYTCTKVTADTAIKSSAGFLHTIILSEDDAAPSAGTIVIYDNTAESGTEVFEWNLTTAVFTPISLTFDRVMTTGIYAGFTTTADVDVTVCYR